MCCPRLLHPLLLLSIAVDVAADVDFGRLFCSLITAAASLHMPLLNYNSWLDSLLLPVVMSHLHLQLILSGCFQVA